jgi:aldehyde dehydrogenase (NAD+)
VVISSDVEVRSFDKLFIAGEWISPMLGNRIEVISPRTEEIIASVPAGSAGDIDSAVRAARKAFDTGVWSELSVEERAAAMYRVADEIELRLPEMIHTFTAEVGAPTSLSEHMHRMAVNFWRWNAGWLTEFPTTERRYWDGGSGLLSREPVGVVGAIVAWNGPIASIGIKMAPALAAGCTVVAKAAWDGPASTFLLAEALEAAELPPGVVSIVPGDQSAGESLAGHPLVDKISFTGGTIGGRQVMEACSKRVTRVTLELGGKSAGILCDDVAIGEVLPTLVSASVGHSGQTCSAITRVLLPESRYNELVEAIGAALADLRVGDPFEPETALGPLVAERQRDRVESYIKIGREAGGRVVTGGGRPKGLDRGWYVEPTLFADVDNAMTIAREEIFGPVMVAIPYKNDEDAISIANDSDYGLSGAVYSADVERSMAIAQKIRSGQVFVNSAGTCGSQPFGGFKQSGFGREGGKEGIEGYFESRLVAGAPGPE